MNPIPFLKTCSNAARHLLRKLRVSNNIIPHARRVPSFAALGLALVSPAAFGVTASSSAEVLAEFVSKGSGQWGGAPSFSAGSAGLDLQLSREFPGGAYSVSAWIRLDRFIEEGKDGFSNVSPATIVTLYSGSEALVFFSVHKQRLRIAHRMVSGFAVLEGERDLPLGQWVNVTAVADTSGTLRLYQNGEADGMSTGGRHIFRHRVGRAQVGAFVRRALQGQVGAFAMFEGALDEKAVRELAAADSQQKMQTLLRGGLSAAEAYAPPVAMVPAEEYVKRRLQVEPGARVPMAGGHLARTAVIPAHAGGPQRVMVQGATFGASRIVFDPVSAADAKTGSYETIDDEAVFQVGKGNYRPLMAGRDSFFGLDVAGVEPGLITVGNNPQTGNRDLLRLRMTGENSEDFEIAEALQCNGQSFEKAYPGARLSFVGRVDGDAVPDLLLVTTRSVASYYPDAPDHFWVNRPLPNTGAGRGYSVNGKWLGGESIDTYYWAKGALGADGKLSFGPMQPVFLGEDDYKVQWKGYFYSNAAVIRSGGKPYLIMTGDLDQLLALPLQEDGGQLRCGPAVPLLREGKPLRNTYIISALAVADIDGDGKEEILLSGNPGSVSLLGGDAIGDFVEYPLYTRGGPLTMQTLTVPTMADWDGDGIDDIIAGDASGWLMFWPGTNAPDTFGEPRHLTSNGERIHIQAGYYGSVQGPNEARWGYANPLVCDWNNDGTLSLITSDINGDLLLWQRNPQDPFDLLAPSAFTAADGSALNLPWRQRPAFIPADDPLAKGGRPSLLIMDSDGELALATPTTTGAVTFESIEKIRYVNGDPVLTCGPGGSWGRSKFTWVDWDGDGVSDLLMGTNQINNVFFSDTDVGPYSMPFFFKNVGTNAEPRLERAQPLLLNGQRLNFSKHISAMWPLFEGEGGVPSGLLIGAEDGRIYRFERGELTP